MEPVNPRKRLGRPRDPEATARVLDAALQVLADRGLSGFLMDDVAARGSVGKATIYRRWHSADDLLADLVRTLGVRDIAWSEPGTLRDDLIELLHTATTGRRAQAERALLSALPYQPNLRAAWPAGPLRRLSKATHEVRTRGLARGEHLAPLPGVVRVQAAYSWLTLDAMQHGEDPDTATIEGVVDVLLLPPPHLADWDTGEPQRMTDAFAKFQPEESL